jgi:prostamide/prostaglandin F2alpha synthase
LQENGIKLVAVGLEQFGAREFVEGQFFDGEVYIDEQKQTYRDLGYKRFNWISIWKAILSAVSRRAHSEARARNLSGNLAGDGLQNGGLLIVAKGGGQVLLNHCEETPGDHVVNSVILDTLGISPAEATSHQNSDEGSVPTT